MRAKYHVTEEMVAPFKVVEIIEVPGLGRQSAASLCEQMKVKSQHDKTKLKTIKDQVCVRAIVLATLWCRVAVGGGDAVLTNRIWCAAVHARYLKGFYEGKMLIGVAAGQIVQDAKPIVRQLMLDNGQAATYWEPEGEVGAGPRPPCVEARDPPV